MLPRGFTTTLFIFLITFVFILFSVQGSNNNKTKVHKIHKLSRACRWGLRDPHKCCSRAILKGVKNISLANPYMCSRLYVCSNGSALSKVCPYPFHYDPVKEICGWPKAGDCKQVTKTPLPSRN